MSMSRIRWAGLLVMAPLLAGLVGTNIYQDPANIFHDESKAMAEAMVQGHSVYSGTGNVNEREVKKNLIQSMPDEVDTIAVGPSLVMSITAEDVGTDSFYNLGVSAADLYDILAQFGMMEANGKHYKRVILCVDSYGFDENIYNYELASNKALMPYAEYMLDILDGAKPEVVETDTAEVWKTRVEQAVSLTYFQASCDQIRTNGEFSMADHRWGIAPQGYDAEKPFYSPDGSWNYAASYQARGVDYVQAEAAEYNLPLQFAYQRHISSYSMEVYDQLIAYLQSQGVEVELFLCPLSPALWDRMQPEIANYPMLYEISDYAKELSEKYNLKLTGDYDPYQVGITDAEFYDCRHVRKEVLSHYFDFK